MIFSCHMNTRKLPVFSRNWCVQWNDSCRMVDNAMRTISVADWLCISNQHQIIATSSLVISSCDDVEIIHRRNCTFECKPWVLEHQGAPHLSVQGFEFNNWCNVSTAFGLVVAAHNVHIWSIHHLLILGCHDRPLCATMSGTPIENCKTVEPQMCCI